MKLTTVCLLLAAASQVAALSVPGVAGGLRLRGGALENLVRKPLSQVEDEEKPEIDPKLKTQMAAKVPKINHKDDFQEFKAKNFHKHNKPPIWKWAPAFVKSTFMSAVDFVLDNSGNLIYKALPFAIAVLHLPFFKPVTEGTPAFE
mmetsp:Transcript_1061/g.1776  ORF Transcript_1061/g.1776 Transcript_1061/m.1776 type:complete len:146 (-) Transcript_1061:592-1029(-)|eukprot:CAMPEP_0184324582 /NCGR_PEP_ID=MMETSP1049-20130417/135865_1 /TAXON_ID=77928 /ORGANISM="Proteomonas sulcata, Strain CCMP704" /LENGTH=145 /DNA_ID=CAMNT_0026646385 /DNA_START=175 /DNA_END=612 /DNA_ORIENTATION=+